MLETAHQNQSDRRSTPRSNPRETANAEFLTLVGSRVKKIRKEKKLTRKVLSEHSGVSERYLALLESGQGNVSIALLRQVAQSLDVEPEILISNSAPVNAESRLLLGLLAGLTSSDRHRFKDQLLKELRNSPVSRSFRIALIGLRGAGKTTVGQRLSNILNIPFVEIDREIEKLADAPLSEIFITYGQEGYRNLEKTCLENVLGNGNNCIISTGGSIVQDHKVYDLLSSAFFGINIMDFSTCISTSFYYVVSRMIYIISIDYQFWCFWSQLWLFDNLCGGLSVSFSFENNAFSSPNR